LAYLALPLLSLKREGFAISEVSQETCRISYVSFAFGGKAMLRIKTKILIVFISLIVLTSFALFGKV
jgi:hypothetical protein